DFFFEAEDGIRDFHVTGVQTCALPILVNEGIAVFQGTLSLENNGGFASVRSGAIEQDLGKTHGVVVRVRGDGKTYQFRIWTTGRSEERRVGKECRTGWSGLDEIIIVG